MTKKILFAVFAVFALGGSGAGLVIKIVGGISRRSPFRIFAARGMPRST